MGGENCHRTQCKFLYNSHGVACWQISITYSGFDHDETSQASSRRVSILLVNGELVCPCSITVQGDAWSPPQPDRRVLMAKKSGGGRVVAGELHPVRNW